MDRDPGLDELSIELREFVRARHWGQYHDAKSLVLALMGEVGELAELIQWKDTDTILREIVADPAEEKGSSAETDARQEIADIFIYLLHLADLFEVDLVQAAFAKLEKNKIRFPVIGSNGAPPSKD